MYIEHRKYKINFRPTVSAILKITKSVNLALSLMKSTRLMLGYIDKQNCGSLKENVYSLFMTCNLSIRHVYIVSNIVEQFKMSETIAIQTIAIFVTCLTSPLFPYMAILCSQYKFSDGFREITETLNLYVMEAENIYSGLLPYNFKPEYTENDLNTLESSNSGRQIHSGEC